MVEMFEMPSGMVLDLRPLVDECAESEVHVDHIHNTYLCASPTRDDHISPT